MVVTDLPHLVFYAGSQKATSTDSPRSNLSIRKMSVPDISKKTKQAEFKSFPQTLLYTCHVMILRPLCRVSFSLVILSLIIDYIIIYNKISLESY